MLTQQREGFVVDYFKTEDPARSYFNHYSCKNLLVASAAATRLLKDVKIQQRLKELRNQATSDAIMLEIERKERLSQIGRATLVDFISKDGYPTLSKETPHHQAAMEYEVRPTKYGFRKSIKLRDPVSAIQELNKMEHIYDVDMRLLQDNRVINIIVSSEKAKELTENVSNRFKQIERGDATE